jgi:hypothetical protein
MDTRRTQLARPWRGIPAAVFAVLAWAGAAAAAEEFEVSRYGGRIGFSADPDQFTIGAYAGLGELAPHLTMRPSVDMGFGDNLFSVILNADVQYSFVIGSAVAPYAGGGLGIGYYKFDTPDNLPAGVDFDDSTTEIGLNLYGGAEMDLGGYKSGYAELRIGIDDLPDLKLTLGLGFY